MEFSSAEEQAELSQEILKCLSLISAEEARPFSLIRENLGSGQSFRTCVKEINAYFALRGRTYKDHQIPIITGDGGRIADPELIERGKKVIVILDNLRSVFNVGSIFRTAECLSLNSLILCGTTPTPEHPNMNKTAMGTCDLVRWSYMEDTIEAISQCRRSGYHVLALETAEHARSIFAGGFTLPIALVIGNESLGISPEVIELCDTCANIPVLGWKNSLNVGVAFAITAYQMVCER